jgi:C1A family cysteine protease
MPNVILEVKPNLELVKKIDSPYKNSVMGFKKDPVDQRDFLFKATMPIKTEQQMQSLLLTLPTSIDYSNNMSAVKDQGQLGSCVAFATTAVKEWQEIKEYGLEIISTKNKPAMGTKLVRDLSEQWVYWNCKKIDPWPNEEGTSIRYAMKVLQHQGIPFEKEWPYSDTVVGSPSKLARKIAKWLRIESYWRITTISELKAALVNNGPIPIGVLCFEEIFTVGANGIISDPKNPDQIYGGHAICAVGFDDSKKLVKFKNSWSSGWGEKGYGYLSYNYINEYMLDAWVCKDMNMQKVARKELAPIKIFNIKSPKIKYQEYLKRGRIKFLD